MASRSSGSKSTQARSGAARGGARSGPASRRRVDKSLEAFREALERNVTVSRDRLQEVVDDAVKRGRMTRRDANDLVSSLINRGRKQTDELLRDLERLLEQARKEVEARTAETRRQATRAAGKVSRRAREAASRPLAEAGRLRRRGAGGGAPISGYDALTVAQVRTRLRKLSAADLRKVRTYERNHKARKGVLDEIDRLLAKP